MLMPNGTALLIANEPLRHSRTTTHEVCIRTVTHCVVWEGA